MVWLAHNWRPLLAYSLFQAQFKPVTPGDAIFALIAGGILLICAGDAETSQITDEHGRTFCANPSDLKQVPKAINLLTAIVKSQVATVPAQGPALSMIQPLRGKRVNSDPATRIAGMARARCITPPHPPRISRRKRSARSSILYGDR